MLQPARAGAEANPPRKAVRRAKPAPKTLLVSPTPNSQLHDCYRYPTHTPESWGPVMAQYLQEIAQKETTQSIETEGGVAVSGEISVTLHPSAACLQITIDFGKGRICHNILC